MVCDDPPPSVEQDPGVTGGATSLSLDTVLELLSNRRRRFAIYTLLELPAGMVGFDDLVQDVAELEATASPGSDGDLPREHVATDLHHWHLPVLEETEVLVYDDRSDIVQYAGDPLLETWARRVRGEELVDAT